jgi:hypothetical protein
MTLLSRRSGAIDGAALRPYHRLPERNAIAQTGYPTDGRSGDYRVIGDRTRKGSSM